MKKTIINISLAFSLLFIITSCEKDFLTEVPKDRITTTNFFESINNLEVSVNAAYRQMVQDAWGRSIGSARIRTLFTGADDWTTQPGGNKGDWKEGDQLNISSANANISNTGWNMPFDVILQANFAIQGKDILIEKGINQANVNAVVAEAYFLRSWAYFWLVRLYGGVPLVLSPESSDENRNLARSTEIEVYDQILSDLDFALEYLPKNQAQIGRVSYWAAKALRAKVYLTMASYPLQQTTNYALALQDAADIINNGPFKLEENFADIFDIENEDTNTEYIWQIRFCNLTNCPGQGLITPFASQTTKPAELGGFQDLFIEKAFYNKFPEGTRKDFTFLSQLISQEGTITSWQNFGWKRPFLSKFYSGTVDKNSAFEPQRGSTAPASELDMPMFRLSEMYFIYAEAHIQGGGGELALALEYINQIRRRAKGSAIDLPDSDDLTSLSFDEIIDERAWEFVGEMKRWFDLIRTEKLAEALTNRDSEELPLIGDPTNKNLYYHPLPDLDLEINPNLTQNPR